MVTEMAAKEAASSQGRLCQKMPFFMDTSYVFDSGCTDYNLRADFGRKEIYTHSHADFGGDRTDHSWGRSS